VYLFALSVHFYGKWCVQDPIVCEYGDAHHTDCLFPTTDRRPLELAEELAREAHSTKDFANMERIITRCSQCGVQFEQPRDVEEHNAKTGHMKHDENETR
jgi:hypothetical protein